MSRCRNSEKQASQINTMDPAFQMKLPCTYVASLNTFASSDANRLQLKHKRIHPRSPRSPPVRSMQLSSLEQHCSAPSKSPPLFLSVQCVKECEWVCVGRANAYLHAASCNVKCLSKTLRPPLSKHYDAPHLNKTLASRSRFTHSHEALGTAIDARGEFAGDGVETLP